MAILWIYLEIYSFFLYVATAVLYLFYISVKGMLGLANRDEIKHQERSKFDALEFYRVDIDWLAFSFVMLILNFRVLHLTYNTYSGEIGALDASGNPITIGTHGIKDFILLGSLCIARILMLVLVPKIRDSSKRINADIFDQF